MKKLMMVMAAALLAMGARAATEVVDGVTWSYTVSKGKATVTGAAPCIGKMTVPAVLGECPVVRIEDEAFKDKSEITEVKFPVGLEVIGRSAFANCYLLTKIDLPSTLREISNSAFNRCNFLQELILPDGLESIAVYAFGDCATLSSIVVPQSVISIGYGNFGMESIESVYVSDLAKWCQIEFGSGSGNPLGAAGEMILNGVKVTEVVIPSEIKVIKPYAFYGWKTLRKMTIPDTVQAIGMESFKGCTGLDVVRFEGRPPLGIEGSDILQAAKTLEFRRENGAEWLRLLGNEKFHRYIEVDESHVEVVSAGIRASDTTVLDVTYRVKSRRPTVKVRTLVFKDGVRSFANVVRPTEFIEGTTVNIGDMISANEEHKLSWRISADWKVDLAKMKFEVLAVEDDLLPLELTTIPKIGDHAAMEISWNAMTEQQVLDAMFWMYADKDERLMVTDGKVYYDGNLAVDGTTLFANKSAGSYYSRTKNPDTGKYDYVYYTNAIECVYSRMGFGTLSGDELKYANEMTRLGLSPSGVRQYAWREVEE